MENKDVRGRKGATRRVFLSASAVTAVAAPLLSGLRAVDKSGHRSPVAFPQVAA